MPPPDDDAAGPTGTQRCRVERTGGALVIDRAVNATDLPLALAEVHHAVEVGERLAMTAWLDGSSPERRPGWTATQVATIVEAAGFGVDDLRSDEGTSRVELRAQALRALPDHVGAGMRMLCVGLNPSLHAADAGVGYVTANNRFWPAMAAAGLATRDRDPRHLLRHDRIGMTDLVKRATARADEVTTAEYRAGVERLEALCRWLRPAVVAIVGLAGWRAGADRRAATGWQPRPLGPSPVYLLPSTSGLNAGTSLAELVEHLHTAANGPPVDAAEAATTA